MKVLSITMGILVILAGMFCIVNPAVSAFAIAWLFGAALLVGGIVSLVDACKREKKSVWDIIFAILTIIAGGILLFSYFGIAFANTVIVVILAITMIAAGVTRIAISMELKKLGVPWAFNMVIGIFLILMAILVFIRPSIGFIVIDVMFSLVLITQGISLIAFGAEYKKN